MTFSTNTTYGQQIAHEARILPLGIWYNSVATTHSAQLNSSKAQTTIFERGRIVVCAATA